MSYHKSNLGKFSSMVDAYADLDGYVPESESDLDKLHYDDPEHCLEDRGYRLVFLEDAAKATEEAEKAIAEWRKENS